MTETEFHNFANHVGWTFAKSIPNWPHFYTLEVHYFDLAGWTYWSSPLAKPFEEKYMINRCRKEYTWDALSKAGELLPEGFEGRRLSLAPVLEDPVFQSLVHDGAGSRDVESMLSMTQRHRKIFHALPYLLEEDSIREQCSAEEFEQLKACAEVVYRN